MFIRQDCAFHPLTGALHTLAATDAALTVNGMEIPGYAGQRHARIVVDGAGVEWILTVREVVTLLRDRQVAHQWTGPLNAGWSALRATDTGVEVYLQGPHDGAGGCVVKVYRPDGTSLPDRSSHYSSNGLIDIASDGTPISCDRAPISFGDLTLWDWTEKSGTYVGTSNGGDTMKGSVGMVKPDGSRWMAQLGQDIQLPPRLAVASGRTACAASGENVPIPLEMPWELAHVNKPPVVVLDPPPLPPAIPPLPPPIPPVDPPRPPVDPPVLPPVDPPVDVGTGDGDHPSPPPKRKWWQVLVGILYDESKNR